MEIWGLHIACWIPAATNTLSEYVSNTYYFTATTMVARTRLNVTLHYIACIICHADLTYSF
jgi:hypothetical protein